MIVKHIVFCLTEVYDRQALRPSDILDYFHLLLRSSHHQCLKMMRFLGIHINNKVNTGHMVAWRRLVGLPMVERFVFDD